MSITRIHAASQTKIIERQRDSAIATLDDLSFVTTEDHRYNFWDVTVPKTKYWAPLRELGRSYAYELLDLVNNPKRKILRAQVGMILKSAGRGDPSIADGFFEVIGNYLTDGDISR